MLRFSVNTKNLIVTGKTFPIKEHLKALGGIWQSPQWLLPLNFDTPLNRANLVEILRCTLNAEKEAEKAKYEYERSPEGKAAALKAALALKATGAYHWICCDQCKVIDWFRQETWCEACSVDYGTHRECYRLRGMIRTGD
jgi:hypothetical protein